MRGKVLRKRGERLLSLLLALTMAFAFVPSAAFAAEGDDGDQGAHEEASAETTAEKIMALLDQIAGMDSSKYTEESWADVQGDYDMWNDKREYLPQYSEGMQGNILSGIQGHIDALVPEKTTAEKIMALLDQIAGMDSSKYTKESWADVQGDYDMWNDKREYLP